MICVVHGVDRSLQSRNGLHTSPALPPCYNAADPTHDRHVTGKLRRRKVILDVVMVLTLDFATAHNPSLLVILSRILYVCFCTQEKHE